MSTKEIAKFASGFAANQTLTHGALAAAGTEFIMFGIAYDQQLNMIAAAIWAVLLALLAYYGWRRPAADR